MLRAAANVQPAFDWRYPTPAPQPAPVPSQPYEALGAGTRPSLIPVIPTMTPLLGWFAQRPRAGMLAVGAVTIAVVSAGIGGALTILVGFNRAPAGHSGGPVAAARRQASPPSKHAAGSVEQLAARWYPVSSCLETDLGRQSERAPADRLPRAGRPTTT